MNTHRFVFLDGMRGIAALAVMIFHFTSNTGFFIFCSAYVAVDLFFCLSGFVIARSYIEKINSGEPLTSLVIKRLIRFFPTYLIALLLGVGAVALNVHFKHWDLSFSFFTPALLLNLIFLPFENSYITILGNGFYPQVGSTFPFNPPAWSLSFEIFVNIIFFLSVKINIITRKPNSLLVYSILIIAAISLILNSHAFGLGSASGLQQFIYGSLRAFSGFYVGYLLTTLPIIKPKRIALPLSVSLILLFLLPSHKITYAILISLMPLFIYVGSITILSRFGSLICSWLGNLSYPIYCIHYPFVFVVNAFFTYDSYLFPYVLLTTVLLVIIISHFIYYHIDEPIRKFLTNYLFRTKNDGRKQNASSATSLRSVAQKTGQHEATIRRRNPLDTAISRTKRNFRPTVRDKQDHRISEPE